MPKPVPFRCKAHIWTHRSCDWSMKLECLLPIHPSHEEHHWRIADDQGRTIEIRWESSSALFEPLDLDPEPVHVDGMQSMTMGSRS